MMQFPSKLFKLPQILLSNPTHEDLLKQIQWKPSLEYFLFPKRYCATCSAQLRKKQLPRVSKENGFKSVEVHPTIRSLNTIEAAAISCILPCFTLSRKPAVTQPKTLGPAVYIPLDPTTTFQKLLPRTKRNLNWVEMQFAEIGRGARQDPTVRGFINKEKVLSALKIILQSPLYQKLHCLIDESLFNSELEDDSNFELIETKNKIETDPQAHSWIMLPEIEYKDQYEVEVIQNDEEFGQFKPFTQMMNPDIPAIVTDTESRIPTFQVLYNSIKLDEELMFPAVFGGYKRHKIKLKNVTLLDLFKNEIERWDLQHQWVPKILHDFFRLTQDNMNKQRAHIYSLFNSNTGQSQNEYIKDSAHDRLLYQIRCGPQFWKRKRGNLMVQIRYLGQPTFFLTISPNEIMWSEMLFMLQYSEEKRTGKKEKKWSLDQIEELTKKERQYLLASNPTVAVKMTMERQNLVKRILWNNKNGIFGEVGDFYIRVEFQMRGSPHFHMMLWVKDAPIWLPDSDENKTQEVINFVNKHITCQYNGLDEDTQKRLSVQLHKHSSCCTTIHGCRFHFPIPPMFKTDILVPQTTDDIDATELQRLHAIYNHKILHSLRNMKNGDQITTTDWLKTLNLTTEEYIFILKLFYVKHPQILLQREPGETNMNKYNTKLQPLWNGNMDLSFIMDPWACAQYVGSYICKPCRELSSTLKDFRERQAKIPDTLDRKIKSFGAKFITSTQIGVQETICHLTRIRLSMSSRYVVWVNTEMPANRIRKKKKENPNSTDSQHNSDSPYQDGPREHYMHRSLLLQHICFGQWIQQFSYKTGNRIRQTNSSYSQQFIFPQNNGIGYSQKRKHHEKDKILKIRPYDPYNNRTPYCYQQLLLWVPWTQPIEADDPHELDVLYEQNIQLIKENKTICGVKDESFVEIFNQHIQKLIVNNWDNEFEFTNYNPNPTRNRRYNTPQNAIKLGQATLLYTAEQFRNIMKDLNQEQRLIIDDFIYRIENKLTPIHLFLEGAGGNGKSYLIDAIVQYSSQIWRKIDHKNIEFAPVLKLAPTGIAAVNIKGSTIHSAFVLPIFDQQDGDTKTMKKGRNVIISDSHEHLRYVKLVIIDEIGATSDKILKELDTRLKLVQDGTQPFGGVSVICAGDYYQLPPIGGKQICNPRSESYDLWKLFQKCTLQTNMRHKNDVQFGKAMEELRVGNCSTETINLLKSRVITKQQFHTLEAENPYNNGLLILHSTNDSVEWSIARRMEDTSEDIQTETAIDFFPGTGQEHDDYLHLKLSTMLMKETKNLPTKLRLRPGFPYMITTNIDVKDGLVNGQIVEIIEVVEKEDDSLKWDTIVWVKGVDTKIGQRARESSIENRAHTDEEAFPLKKVTRFFQVGPYDVKRRQIALVPFAASTYYKAQGRTLRRVLLATVKILKNGDPQIPFRFINMEDLYVGCSRITKREDLYLYPDLPPVIKPTEKQIQIGKWMEIMPKWKPLLPMPQENKLTICFHNGQGATGKKELYETTTFLQRLDILAISEGYDEKIFDNIHQLDKIAEIEGKNKLGSGLSVFINKKTITMEIVWKSVSTNPENKMEGIIIKVTNYAPLEKSKNLIIGFFYINPNSDSREAVQKILQFKQQGYNVLIMGDFNQTLRETDLNQLKGEQIQLHMVPKLININAQSPDIILTNVQVNYDNYPCYFSDHPFLWTQIPLTTLE